MFCNDVARALPSSFYDEIFCKNAMKAVFMAGKMQKITLYIDRKTTIQNWTQRFECSHATFRQKSGFSRVLTFDVFTKTKLNPNPKFKFWFGLYCKFISLCSLCSIWPWVRSTHYSKSQIFVQKIYFDKTTTFSRVFTQIFFDNFSREIKVVNS